MIPPFIVILCGGSVSRHVSDQWLHPVLVVIIIRDALMYVIFFIEHISDNEIIAIRYL